MKRNRIATRLMCSLLGFAFIGSLSACTNSQDKTETASASKASVSAEETTAVHIAESEEVTTPPETETEEPAMAEEYFITLGDDDNGVVVGSNQYVVDMHDVKVTDFEGFKKQLRQLPNLLYIDMCDCGLTNGQMEELVYAFPSTRFVWMIHMTATNSKRTLWWETRTDALAFSTLHVYATDPPLDNDEGQQLRFCEDLVALDFGHNAIYDTSFMKDMDMHILITVDSYNYVEHHRFNSLWVAENFDHLQYLETFVGAITDTSCLKNCKEMLDLNLSYNPISDITYLKDFPKIERFFLESTNVSQADFNELKSIYPNAELYNTGSGSVDHGWRTHPRYYAMIDMFRNNYWNDLFRTEDEMQELRARNLLIVDGVRYYGTPYIAKPEEVESFDFKNTIESSVGAGNIPSENNSCNFDAVNNTFSTDNGNGVLLVQMADDTYRYFYKNEVLARILIEKLDENGMIKEEYLRENVEKENPPRKPDPTTEYTHPHVTEEVTTSPAKETKPEKETTTKEKPTKKPQEETTKEKPTKKPQEETTKEKPTKKPQEETTKEKPTKETQPSTPEQTTPPETTIIETTVEETTPEQTSVLETSPEPETAPALETIAE